MQEPGPDPRSWPAWQRKIAMFRFASVMESLR